MPEQYLSTDPNAGQESEYLSTDPNAGAAPTGPIHRTASAAGRSFVEGA